MTEIEEYREELDAPPKIDDEDLKLWLKELMIAGYDITFHWAGPGEFALPGLHGKAHRTKHEFVSRKFKDIHSGTRINIWKTPSRDSHYLLWTYRWAGGDWWQRTKP
jgi:hypothetical protein